MKTQISQSVLHGAIESAMLAIPSKPSTPIVGCIIIEADDENSNLTIKSTDTAFSIYQIIDAEVEQGGSVAIPGKVLKDTIASLKGELTLEFKDSYFVITHETGQCRLMTNANIDEFPNIENSINDTKFADSVISIPSLKLQVALNSVLYGASSDETKMVLTGVNFSINNNDLCTITTDGHRVARVNLSLEDTEQKLSFTAPAKVLTEVNKILHKAPENSNCTINVYSNMIAISMPGIKVLSRILDGKYPSIETLFPQHFKYEFTIERKAFQATLKRVSNLTDDKDKSVSIGWDITNCTATVHTESSMYGDAHDLISIKPLAEENENLSVGFNIDYLVDAVNSITTDEIIVKCNNSTQPVVIYPIGGLLLQSALVMPLQIRRGSQKVSSSTNTNEGEVNTSSVEVGASLAETNSQADSVENTQNTTPSVNTSKKSKSSKANKSKAVAAV